MKGFDMNKSQNNYNNKLPPNCHLKNRDIPSSFKTCKDNTICSLYDVEDFLCNFKHFCKCINLYNILK